MVVCCALLSFFVVPSCHTLIIVEYSFVFFFFSFFFSFSMIFLFVVRSPVFWIAYALFFYPRAHCGLDWHGQPTTQLAKISIDLKFVKLTADVLEN